MSLTNKDQRKVLLIDGDSFKQQIRAVALRRSEVEVHTASNIADAGRLCRQNSYDLVLLAAEQGSEQAAALCKEVERVAPQQRIALLVGAPDYVREVTRKRPKARPSRPRLVTRSVIDSPAAQPTHWLVMMDRFLAAGRVLRTLTSWAGRTA
jgi:hypothetical protein